MFWWQILLLSVIEGLTEFLPVSSTGHLIFLSNLLVIDDSSFRTTFEISIQVGTIMSVIFLYWRLFLLNWKILLRLGLAFLPAGIIGFIFYNFITSYLMVNLYIIAWALILGGFFMIISEKWYKKQEVDNEDDISKISLKKVFFIGCCQSVALIPGVSRSAATIVGGLWSKLNRKQAVEFSFLLAVPIMAVAGFYDFYKQADYFTTDQFVFLFWGFILSFTTGVLAIKLFLAFIKRYDFIPFGLYRIVIGLVILSMLYLSLI